MYCEGNTAGHNRYRDIRIELCFFYCRLGSKAVNEKVSYVDNCIEEERRNDILRRKEARERRREKREEEVIKREKKVIAREDILSLVILRKL